MELFLKLLEIEEIVQTHFSFYLQVYSRRHQYITVTDVLYYIVVYFFSNSILYS